MPSKITKLLRREDDKMKVEEAEAMAAVIL
jgi:hypothetical protein